MHANTKKEYKIEKGPQPHPARLKTIDMNPLNNTRKDKQSWPVFLSMEPKKTVNQVKLELSLQYPLPNQVKLRLRLHFLLFKQFKIELSLQYLIFTQAKLELSLQYLLFNQVKLELRLRCLQLIQVELELRLLLVRTPLYVANPHSNMDLV